MAKKTNNPADFHLTSVRLAFPHLHKKHASVADGPEKYRAVFIIDPNTSIGKENLRRIKAAREFCENETFGRTGVKYKEDRCCIMDGDLKTDKDGNVYDGFEGMVVVTCSNDTKPAVVDRDPNISLDQDDPIPYAGCYVDAFVHSYCIKDPAKGGAGYFASMEVVQFRKDGTPFGKKAINASDVMGVIEDEDDDLGDERPARPAARKPAPAADLDDDDLDGL